MSNSRKRALAFLTATMPQELHPAKRYVLATHDAGTKWLAASHVVKLTSNEARMSCRGCWMPDSC